MRFIFIKTIYIIINNFDLFKREFYFKDIPNILVARF